MHAFIQSINISCLLDSSGEVNRHCLKISENAEFERYKSFNAVVEETAVFNPEQNVCCNPATSSLRWKAHLRSAWGQ